MSTTDGKPVGNRRGHARTPASAGAGTHRRASRAACELRTITFEDDGQDFLQWDIDRAGKVVACRPFQSATWCGCVVLNHRIVRPGDYLQIVSPRVSGPLRLVHPVKSIAPHARPDGRRRLSSPAEGNRKP